MITVRAARRGGSPPREEGGREGGQGVRQVQRLRGERSASGDVRRGRDTSQPPSPNERDLEPLLSSNHPRRKIAQKLVAEDARDAYRRAVRRPSV